MPIQGMTGTSAEPVRLGKIYLGTKRPSDTQPGKDLQYFRIEPFPAYEFLREPLIQLVGETPAEFRNVGLLGNTTDEIFETWLEQHKASHLVHRCDGETQVAHWDEKSQSVSREPIACVHASGGKCLCAPRGKLRIVFYDLLPMTGVVGYFLLETGSKNAIPIIDRGLRWFEAQYGSLRGFTYRIGRAPQKVYTTNKDGARIGTMKSLIYVMIEPEQVKKYISEAVAHNNQLMIESRVNAEGEILPPLPSQVQIPATVIEVSEGYDMEELEETTSGMFDHPAHQQNALAKMREDGELYDEMSLDEAVLAVRANRNRRALEKGTFWQNPDEVKQLVGLMNTATQLSPGQILDAINMDTPPHTYQRFSEIQNLTRERAWALVLLYAHENDFEAAKNHTKDNPAIVAEIEAIQAQQVPF